MQIKFFDMFSGIGGFRAAFEKIDGFECIGHCEINKFANKSYNAIFNTEGEWFCDDARKIDPTEMPDFDLLCAGFPCQPFSQCGKKAGFNDTRGTLFFEIARLAREKRPKYLLLENVPSILTHDKCQTFNTILSTLSELGYHVEWQVLNSKDFSIPQSRKRVYAFCYIDERCAGAIFPIFGENSQILKQLVGGRQGQRVYDTNGLSCTLTSGDGGFAGKSGLYFIDLNESPTITDNARCIKSRYNSGISNRTGENSGVLVCNEPGCMASSFSEKNDQPIPLLTPERLNKRQNGKRWRKPNSPMFTIMASEKHGILQNGRIRKLMPQECLKLQSFSDEQISKIMAVNSDNQVYAQAGNSVTVNVVYEIGLKIKAIDEKINQA